MKAGIHQLFRTHSILLILCGAYFLGWLVMYCSGAMVWDDAFMFSRYADNLLSEGELTWNLGEAAPYGLTSQLFLVPVLVFRTVFSGSPDLALYLSSFVCGLALLFGLYQLVTTHADRFGKHRLTVIAFLGLSLAFASVQLAEHFSSGMDTCLAMTWLAAYLYFFKKYERRLSPGKALMLGILGGLAWFVRPDLVLFSIGLPLALALRSRRKLIRIQALYVLIFTAFTLLTQVLISQQLYGSVLPLPFFAKAMNPYGPAILEHYASLPWMYFGLFEVANWLPLLFIPLAPWLNWKKWRMHFTLGDKALIACCLAFAGYYLLMVIQIMPYSSRFFYPLLPAAIYLGAKSLIFVLEEKESWKNWLNEQWEKRFAPVPIMITSVLFVVFAFAYGDKDDYKGHFASFNAGETWEHYGQDNWPFLSRFSKLSDQLVMATTEVGMPAALNPRKKIVDLAGLNDQRFAKEGFSADLFFDRYQPDLIYMPHPHYAEMNEELRKDARFKEKYLYLDREEMDSYQSIALLRSSPWFHQMKFIVEDELQKKTTPEDEK